ncbi:MAG: sigma-70 family RNA polymerase sigma factor [Verrucomicrobiota bacterium]
MEFNQKSADFLDEAFVAEISDAQTPLRAYILKLVGNHHAAQDVLQETNVILWKKRMDWDPNTLFLKWAFRVAYFQTKAHFRDQSRERKRLTFSDELIDQLALNEPNFTSEAQLQEALNHCLEKMDTDKRNALIQRYAGKYSVEEIAKQIGLNPNTLSQNLRRLRSKLSICIQSRLQTT